MSKSKNAFGFCDRTGFRYPINDLVPQYVNRQPTGLLVGKDMLDIDHEQLQLGEVDANDPQTLDDPRPDTSLAQSREMKYAVGLDRIGLSASVGSVTVSTS